MRELYVQGFPLLEYDIVLVLIEVVTRFILMMWLV